MSYNVPSMQDNIVYLISIKITFIHNISNTYLLQTVAQKGNIFRRVSLFATYYIYDILYINYTT